MRKIMIAFLAAALSVLVTGTVAQAAFAPVGSIPVASFPFKLAEKEMTAACQAQWPSGTGRIAKTRAARATYTNAADAYSWACMKSGHSVGPLISNASGPALWGSPLWQYCHQFVQANHQGLTDWHAFIGYPYLPSTSAQSVNDWECELG